MGILNSYQETFKKNILNISYKTGLYQREIFADNVSCMAISISNSTEMNKERWQKREDEYLKIIKKYSKEHIELFCQNLACMVNGFEMQVNDFLGGIYEGLEMHNKNAGQFFTPIHIATLMSKCAIPEIEYFKIADSTDVFTVNDPTCGAGNLFLGVINEINSLIITDQQKAAIQRNLLFIGQDLDLLCARMTYVQLSILGYAAVVQNMNTLTQECFETLYSPSYFVFGSGIRYRNRCRREEERRIKQELVDMLNSDLFLRLGA